VFSVIAGRFGKRCSPRSALVKAPRIVEVSCKLHNCIIEERVCREGADINPPLTMLLTVRGPSLVRGPPSGFCAGTQFRRVNLIAV
jgi:hypothetical protein